MNKKPELIDIIQIIKSIAARLLTSSQRCDRACKDDGSFVTDTDELLQFEIARELHAKWPTIRLLGEEMKRREQLAILDATNHSDDEGVWVLDPLDGTTNFSSGLPLYGISLALVQNGNTELAVVYDPVRDECFSAKKGQGAWLNDKQLRPSVVTQLSDCLANVDYKRLTSDLAAELVSRQPYRSQRNLGTCVLEWCWLASDRIQVYLHGGQQLWDHAAGHLILQEAGGQAATLDGKKISGSGLNKQSAVAAANPVLFQQWQRWINTHSDAQRSRLTREASRA